MDEPTAALSSRETQRLFELILRLRDEGMAIIYISHRMAEVYELSDRGQRPARWAVWSAAWCATSSTRRSWCA
ncbi:ribose ABC transporter ATP-binding protein RbsA [Klebsiella pneumoniae]|uniref:Ribose ABC transporter ATP-binding protein RbsA n=1 Tax=Klebsiella pneumoniae TaxID=573 RepID=A0A3S4KGN0_KLEPN|nr:ribose ABC transporter ATP-binding protein RbsA [Klebsiella pneumoniae]